MGRGGCLPGTGWNTAQRLVRTAPKPVCADMATWRTRGGNSVTAGVTGRRKTVGVTGRGDCREVVMGRGMVGEG